MGFPTGALVAGLMAATAASVEMWEPTGSALPGDGAPVEAILAGAPRHCASLPEADPLCTWRGDGRHWVCPVPASGPVEAASCQVQPDAPDDPLALPALERVKQRDWRRRVLSRMRQRARRTLDEAASFDGLVALVGAGPVACRGEPEGARCRWRVDPRTPGYPTLARAHEGAEASLALDCRLAREDGGWSRRSCELGTVAVDTARQDVETADPRAVLRPPVSGPR